MFDKLIETLVTTPLAKRLLAGYIERVLLALCTIAATYAHLEAGTFESQAAKLAADAAPLLVAIVFGLIAQARMKKAEVTIEAARGLPQDTPRHVVDAHARTLIAWPPAQTRPEPRPKVPDYTGE